MNTYKHEGRIIYFRDGNGLQYCVYCHTPLEMNMWACTECWNEMTAGEREIIRRLPIKYDGKGSYLIIPDSLCKRWRD